MVMNEQDEKAIYEKLEHPEQKVICPRCGKELIYRKIGNSSTVKCQSNDCIDVTVRGI